MQNDSSSSSITSRNDSLQTLPRLTVTLPPLRSISKGLSKKQKGKLPLYAEPVQKLPRPVKLKPLKEVLLKLINQIKKRDDYAFFLQPVDASQVTGYSDIVKNPMDFGTMTTKVERNRYRSLEDFKNDLLLVTSNAKKFNPPTSVFHTEAVRIEFWALDHIQKAAAHVIEYETDWNIDVVADTEPMSLTEDVEPNSTSVVVKMDIDDVPARSPSVVSTPQGTTFPTEKSRRSRASGKKHLGIVTESFEPDGHLPGAKDGLNAFPPGSDLASLMLILKLRRRRLRSKKERLRLEKEGPPYASDGSLDYLEMDDPFSLLQLLAPGPPEKPELLPVLPQRNDPSPVLKTDQKSEEPVETEFASNSTRLPVPIAIPLESIPSILSVESNTPSHSSKIIKRKHWRLERVGPSRSRARDAEDAPDASTVQKRPRLDDITDYGPYSTLAGALAAHYNLKASNLVETLGTEEHLFNAIRQSLENDTFPDYRHTGLDGTSTAGSIDAKKFQLEKVLKAMHYLTDIVYGGIDGLAYVRSLAEFVGGDPVVDKIEMTESENFGDGILGMPLYRWVEKNVVDTLTSGLHSIIREASQTQLDQTSSPALIHYETIVDLIDSQGQIELAPLIRSPHEFYLAENEWAGASYKTAKKEESELEEDDITNSSAAEYLAHAIMEHHKAELVTSSDIEMEAPQSTSLDTVEVIQHALNVGADSIKEASRRITEKDKYICYNGTDEDPLLRKLRLNLLGVAKRAPLDKIARLPAELIPAHIRDMVPTIAP